MYKIENGIIFNEIQTGNSNIQIRIGEEEYSEEIKNELTEEMELVKFRFNFDQGIYERVN